MHLKDDEFIDLLERCQPDARVEEHLRSCTPCREKLADLGGTLKSVSGVDVPEPSPLFWDHFSRRVHDAVAAEAADRPARAWVPWLLPATAALALLLFVVAPGVWQSTGQ